MRRTLTMGRLPDDRHESTSPGDPAVKHRSHVIPFVLVALAAMIVLVPRSGTGFGVGLGLVLLLCPLVMGTMMWLMMRRPGHDASPPQTKVEIPE